MSILAVLSLLSCTGPQRPAPTAEPGASVALAHVDPAELTVPDASRSEPPERIPISEWRNAGTSNGLTTWIAELPIRSRAMFFMSAPEGMKLLDAEGKTIRHGRMAPNGAPPHWIWDAHTLRVTLASDQPRPDGATLVYPRATERSRALNRSWSVAESDLDFVRTEMQFGTTSHAGLLLPAPSRAVWAVDVPVSGELKLAPALVAPEIADGASDGADLVVAVDGVELARFRLSVGSPANETVDLSAFAGQSVRLALSTEAVGTPDYDYVFVGEPAVISRAASPKRVVLVFVDTLRPDHLSLYGYERETTPWLDHWAGDAAVFDNARSVAPWTLPTTRTMLTGRQPEYYGAGATVQGRFAAAGFATAMLAGNVYLGANFDIHRDWGTHDNLKWPPADQQVDSALAWLEKQDGRDAFLLVHFMDAHLPYVEPSSHRRIFAGDAVAPLGEEFHRNQVPRRPSEAQQQYVIDRYDNNIRFVNDELSRLVAQLGPDDTVLFLADHGEEFWEHGGFEHGHTLYDEVLRVPMILRTPGIAGTRITEPVSMLDVTPTLLDAAGLPYEGLHGASLLAAARGDESAKAALAQRDQAFGRPLYGRSRWGVLSNGQKYTTHLGEETLYDLRTDAAETRDVLGSAPEVAETWRERTGKALRRDMPMGYRLQLAGARGGLGTPVTVSVDVPGGVRAAWEGHDPLNRSWAEVAVDGDTFTATWKPGTRNAREVFFAPNRPLAELTHVLRFTVKAPGGDQVVCVPSKVAPAPGVRRAELTKTRAAGRALTIGWGVFPNRDATAEVIDATDAENLAALEALGYTEDEQPDEPHEPVELVPCEGG